MSLVGVPELRQLQKLPGPGSDEGLLPQLLQLVGPVGDDLIEEEEQGGGHGIGERHEPQIHLPGADTGEALVQELGNGGQLLRLHRQLQMQQLGADPLVAEHQDRDEALGLHPQQLKALDGKAALPGGSHVGGIVHIAADGLARLTKKAVELLHLQAECVVDLLSLGDGKALALHELVDVEPVALGGRHPPGGGVGLLQIAQLHQIRQLIAHGGGAHAYLRGDGLGTHRLRGRHVILHHGLQYLLFPLTELHGGHLVLL